MSLMCIDPEKLYQNDPNIKRDDVKILQEWLKKQPHLPPIEEGQLIIFLHSCYYRIEATKTTIENHFTVRTLCPNLFSPLTKDEIKKVFTVAFINVLPKTTPENNFIQMAKLIDFKAENFNLVHLINVFSTVGILHIFKKGAHNGAVAVLDATGFSFSHLTRLNLTAVKHALYFVQECAPVRIKQIHVVNVTSIVDKLLGLVKPILKTELYEMIQLHQTVESLNQFVPKECLPEEYGGLLPSCDVLQEENLRYTLDNYEFLKWYDTQKVDEKKRVGKPKTVNEVFGVEGTFKKLEID